MDKAVISKLFYKTADSRNTLSDKILIMNHKTEIVIYKFPSICEDIYVDEKGVFYNNLHIEIKKKVYGGRACIYYKGIVYGIKTLRKNAIKTTKTIYESLPF